MKKTLLTGALLLFITGMTAQTTTTDLPQRAQDFISTNFSSETVERVEKENDWFDFDNNEMYEIYLSNGIRVDFNKKGEPTEVTTRKGAKLPEAAIPQGIRSYISANYSGAEIVAWELDDKKQEVELSDGRELEIDRQNNFVKED